MRYNGKNVKIHPTVHSLRKSGVTVKVRHDRQRKKEDVYKGGAIETKGGTTRVRLYLNNELIGSGLAICNSTDNYNRKLGTKIALGRAFRQAVESNNLVPISSELS